MKATASTCGGARVVLTKILTNVPYELSCLRRLRRAGRLELRDASCELRDDDAPRLAVAVGASVGDGAAERSPDGAEQSAVHEAHLYIAHADAGAAQPRGGGGAGAGRAGGGAASPAPRGANRARPRDRRVAEKSAVLKCSSAAASRAVTASRASACWARSARRAATSSARRPKQRRRRSRSRSRALNVASRLAARRLRAAKDSSCASSTSMRSRFVSTPIARACASASLATRARLRASCVAAVRASRRRLSSPQP